MQWWWRKPQRSDRIEQLFWLDDDGPVAGVLLTSSADDSWQCDPIVVPGISGSEPDVVWSRALEHAAEHAATGFDVPISDDGVFDDAARRSGLRPGYRDSTGWMDAADRPAVSAPADGFTLADRAQRLDVPHHMRHRSGDMVEQRLAQCSLYDPSLDLVVEATDGRVAGYSDADRWDRSLGREGRRAGEDLLRERNSRPDVPRCRIPADVQRHLVPTVGRVSGPKTGRTTPAPAPYGHVDTGTSPEA